jgi:hypothetical protein
LSDSSLCVFVVINSALQAHSRNRAATPTAHAVFLFDKEADEAERKAEDEEREEDDPPGSPDALADDGRGG